MSALATIVGSLGELTESELRQLYLMVGVRLGIPDVPTGVKPQGLARAIGSNATTSRVKGQSKSTSSRGNPARKSQWANHPLYKEYSRLKKVVEAQSKERNVSFNSVDTAESRAYKLAFNQWLEAKCSFRDHRKGVTKRVNPDKKEKDAEESSEEE